MAGPPVVERAFATPVGKEELGGGDIHGANGTVDNVVDSEREPIDDAVSSAIAHAGARHHDWVKLSGSPHRGGSVARGRSRDTRDGSEGAESGTKSSQESSGEAEVKRAVAKQR